MSTENAAPPAPKALYWIGWVLSLIPAGMMTMGGVMAILQPVSAVKGMEDLGYPVSVATAIGTIALSCVVLYLIPKTSMLGGILIAAYLGGATASHVRVGDPWIAPVIVGIVAWLGLLLREPRLRTLLPLRT